MVAPVTCLARRNVALMYESDEQWRRGDEYFIEQLCPEDESLSAVRRASRVAGLPEVKVAPNQAKFLALCAPWSAPDACWSSAPLPATAPSAALKLAHPGTVIVGDNVAREGAVADPASPDPRVVGTRALIELMAANDRLDATALQTVGVKGWDGFALARVIKPAA